MEYIAYVLENIHSNNDDDNEDNNKRKRSEEELRRVEEFKRKKEEETKQYVIDFCHRYNRTYSYIDIFTKALYNGDVDVASWMYTYIKKNKIKFDIHNNNDHIFREICRRGHLESLKIIFKFITPASVKLHYNNDEAFRNACSSGNIELVKYLFYLDNIRPYTSNTRIDIYSEDNYAIRHSCILGYDDIVRLLLSRGSVESFDLSKNSNYIFAYTFISGYIDLANLISSFIDHDVLLVDMCKKVYYLNIIDYMFNNNYSPDLFYKDNLPFITACKNNHIDTANYLVNYNREVIHYDSDIALRELCYFGNIKMVKWLLSQDEIDRFDLTYNNNEIFKLTCINGKLNIAKLLYPLFDNGVLNIHDDNDSLIKTTYEKKKFDVARWLFTLDTTESFDINLDDYPKLK